MIDDPYRDSAGAPRLHPSAVLFFDLFGTVSAGETDAQRQLRRMYLAFESAKGWWGAASDVGLHDPDSGRWFSDNLALSSPIEVPWDCDGTAGLGLLVTQAAAIQATFAVDQLIGRGGIAVGPYFSGKGFVFGPALNRAVELEHARAMMPRIVLDERAIAIARTGLRNQPDEDSPWRQQLAVDTDGSVFVNYLSAFTDDAGETDVLVLLRQHCEVVREGLYRFDGTPHIEDKWRWLARYHDAYVRSVGEGLTAFGIDVHNLLIKPSGPGLALKAFGEGS